MSQIARFGVSLEKNLLDKFDKVISAENYTNRSEALRDLIREKLVRIEWKSGKNVAASISIVYDHHHRELVGTLTDIQHDFQDIIISVQHVHLDHDNCFEVIVVRGKSLKIEELANKLKSARGVKFSQLSMATTGKEII
ncbi:CopG family transcriptional regulator [Candidatus Omnitrophus magneticus]|uniref:Putative nickel-responsive regulator n=1 Tax=Candidatus Omnitrophus magneticus TaxID=1609969 RepID=A0A0F0CRT6_9BACT|nr:CopG family transcriptional regulator [Candidatus Omnitrophus magneticus]